MILLIFVSVSCDTTGNSSSIDTQTTACSIPFSRGVNFNQWFESSSSQGINFSRFGEQDFRDIKSLGVDVIRLPINIPSMTSGPPDYTFDPPLLKLLDRAVDWAEKHEIYIILDNHPHDSRGIPATTEHTKEILVKIWPQMAAHFKDRSKYVLYEILNEPNGMAADQWGRIQGELIEVIRKIDPKHTIIVGGVGYNSVDGLLSLPKYADNNLIYTFHFYSPFIFTHQGADWTSTSLAPLAGVPFPYDSERMPSTPDTLKGTWVESDLRNYPNKAALSSLSKSLDQAVTFSRKRHVPIFCGEFGVFMPHSPAEDRVRWYKFVAEALDQRKIPWTSLDYYDGFGLFNTPDGGDFNADLNVDLVRALGFTPPPQRTGPPEPLKSGFTIYDDYFGQGYWVIHHTRKSTFDMYDTAAATGEYAIRWGNLSKHDMYQVRFKRNEDFSSLVQSGYCLEFQVRTGKPIHFSVWFANPENASSLPWQVRYVIDEKLLPPDGKWHTIRIPLSDMREDGVWIDATREWLEPQGKFSWRQTHDLTFSADSDCKDCTVWFDDIKIVK